MKFDTIPEELKQLKQWVLWKIEIDSKGKPTKVPYKPNGVKASTTRPTDWSDFNTVCTLSKNYNGIGFVFTKNDNYIGIDLDKCIEKGEVQQWATGIIDIIGSYTSISQGGAGIHIILKGTLPQNTSNKKDNIEIYAQGRYFCMTDFIYNDLSEIKEFPQISQFLDKLGMIKDKGKPPDPQTQSSPNMTNDQILTLISKASNGPKIQKLLNGDTSDYPSPSEADLAIANFLAFYTQDFGQIVNIISQTPLWDKKWQRPDYQKRTIGKALSDLSETHKPIHRDQPKPNTVKNPNDPKTHFAVIDEIILRVNNSKNALKECEFYAKSITIPNLSGKVWNYAISKLGYSGTQAKIEMTVKNAKDLKHTEMPEINWIIPGYLPEGLTLLCGKPKMGKSWLALSIAVSVSIGGMAFGKIPLEEREGKVLYLALEDNERRMKKRLNSLCQFNEFPEKLYYSTVWDKGQAGVNALRSWVESNREDVRLVVIDTLVSFRAKSNGKSNNEYDKDSGDLEPLQSLAGEFGIGIVVIHHLRKASSIDDDFDTISGTLGLTGKADTNIIFTRARGEADAVLKGTGRDFDEDFEIAMKMDPVVGWAMIGDAQDYQMGKSRQSIYDVLKETTVPISAKDIIEMLGKNASTTRSILSKMVSEGIIKYNKGRYLLLNK